MSELLTPLEILQKYWSYDSFREQQNEIIDALCGGRDVLAILPTGGGKSICFQIPALLKEGITVVISPLIALMQDQVANLNSRGIKATAIYSGMSKHEIDVTLDNCAYGDYKLLYVSPERISTEIFTERVKKMKVNFLAVDEAHCISQWGHDFRPSYRNLAQLRSILVNVPVIALTASATLPVRKDIAIQLEMKNPTIFEKSFYRDNLSFVVRKVDNKVTELITAIKKMRGSGIVYVRNRKMCKEVSQILSENGVAATYYHAGLKSDLRTERQAKWMKEEVRIMVCTNAFGMGIDKANVRFVFHLGLVDSLEAYYQEAGRAGRDGKKSFAGIFYQQRDVNRLEQSISTKFPELSDVRKVYTALGSHFQIAVGSGHMMTKDFDLFSFCKRFNFDVKKCFASLKMLETAGYIMMNDGLVSPSKIKFKLRKNELYNFQVEWKKYDSLIKVLLRTYGGILDHYTVISEQVIASKLNTSVEVVKENLSNLLKKKVLAYLPYKDEPNITFLTERMDGSALTFDREFIAQRKEQTTRQVEGILKYVLNESECRQIIIASYFGEKSSKRCMICDNCLKNKHNKITDSEFEIAKKEILNILRKKGHQSLQTIISEQRHYFKSKRMQSVVRRLIDENVLYVNAQNQLCLNE